MNLSRRNFVKESAALSLIGMFGTANSAPSSKKAPNLVIVFPDQMRGQALGFLNEDPVVTPNLDRFAKESLTLKQAVSNYPVCSPFRAMLLTGKYPHANGVISNCTSHTEPHGVELKESDICWPDVLKTKGYSLGYIGKWHLDSPHAPYIKCNNNRGKTKWNEWCPPNRRHSFDFWYSYGTYDYHMNPMYWSTDAIREEFTFVKQWGPEHEADLAINYINNKDNGFRKADQPFALVVSMNPPHTPYNQFPKKYLKAYKGKTDKDLLVRPNVDTSGETPMSKLALTQTKNYFANITGVDDQFGRIVKAIDDAGLKEDTIVLFTSDHGNCVGTHNQQTKNNRFEESMRIPFIMRWPGKIKPRQDNLLISVPDIYPTLLDMMGFKSSTPASVKGKSHAALFLTGKGMRPTSQMFINIPYRTPGFGQRGVRTLNHKLVIKVLPDKPKETILYDLQTDPYELKNIAAQNPEIVKTLIQKELIPWLKSSADPFTKNL